MKWEDMSARDLQALPRDVPVVLPTAAIEQHGPHLPTGTDSFIAEGIASTLDKACGERLVILPVQRIGVSEHHMALGGTLTLTHATFQAAVTETLHSLARHGFRRVLVLNCHGGNQAIGGVIAEQAVQRWPEMQVLFTSWWRAGADRLKGLVEGAFPSVGHACEFETSLMLALRPGLVNMKLAVDDGLPHPASLLRGDLFSGPAATLAVSFDKLTKQGVYGRATLANAQKGERILSETVLALRELLEACWNFKS